VNVFLPKFPNPQSASTEWEKKKQKQQKKNNLQLLFFANRVSHFLKEDNANWWTVRGKKIISYADAVKLPPSGANVVPIHKKKAFKNVDENIVHAMGRTSVFKRLSSSSHNSGSLGIQNSMAAKNKAISLKVPSHRALSSVSTNFDINGGAFSRGCRGHAGFWNSNLNLLRPCNLQWRPIQKKGSGRPMGVSLSSGHVRSSGPSPVHFLCQFCQVRGHLELFC
jgi:hypothetical protein